VGVLLLLDVEMAAPVITIPRNSNSRDALEVDLGTLKLTNRLAWLGNGGTSSRRVRSITAQKYWLLLASSVRPLELQQDTSMYHNVPRHRGTVRHIF
jgi:hypothetical protein